MNSWPKTKFALLQEIAELKTSNREKELIIAKLIDENRELTTALSKIKIYNANEKMNENERK